ncbi:hypothetical protein pipiens_010815, partial [Culex pipiens pipiens]
DLVDRFCNRDDLRSDLMLNNGQAVVHDQPEASSSAGAKSLKRRRNKDQLVEFRPLSKAQEMNRRLEEAVERDRYLHQTVRGGRVAKAALFTMKIIPTSKSNAAQAPCRCCPFLSAISASSRRTF